MIKGVYSSIVPQQIKGWIKKFIFNFQFWKVSKNHKKALEKVRKKEKIKVAFFVIKSSVWKFDLIYRMMEKDERFEPLIVICPYTLYGEESMLWYMNQAYNFFAGNNYKVIKTLDSDNGKWLNIKKEINPDIIFFTVHWGVTKSQYQIHNYTKFLTCYSTYTFVISYLYEGYFNQEMQNLVWKFFLETNTHQKLAFKYSRNKGINTVVTGYPGMDKLIQNDYLPTNVWKLKDKNIKRIIWSPHHTINGLGADLDYSTFLKYYDFMFELASKYQDQIQIAFKPHPVLRTKLSLDDYWGKEKTDKYFQKWADLPNGQLNEGEYFDLFATSDGLINDSSAFVIEYLYTGKPMMFLKNDEHVADRMNEIGQKALTKLYIGNNKSEIERFITEIVIEENDLMKNERIQFFDAVIKPPNNRLASENIYENIKSEIFLLS